MLLPAIFPLHDGTYPALGLEELFHHLIILVIGLPDSIALLVVVDFGPSLLNLIVIHRGLSVCISALHDVQQRP